MPIHEFWCKTCDKKVERFRGIGETGDTLCPTCGFIAGYVMSCPNLNFAPWKDKANRSAQYALTPEG